MDYESAFERAGTLGRAQFLIIVMVHVVYIYAGWQTIVPVFTAIDVPFYCADNETSMLLLKFFGSHMFLIRVFQKNELNLEEGRISF